MLCYSDTVHEDAASSYPGRSCKKHSVKMILSIDLLKSNGEANNQIQRLLRDTLNSYNHHLQLLIKLSINIRRILK